MTGTPCDSGFAGFRRTSAAILALLLLLPSGAHGDVLTVDFPEAVSRAMKNNPFLSAAGEEWTAAKEDAVAARGYYLPSVALEGRFIRTNIPSEGFAFKINQERLLPSDFASVDNFNKPSPINEYMTALTVEQALFAPKAWLGRRMAVREAGAKGLELRRMKEEVAYQVLSAYLGVLTAKESLQVAIRGEDDAKEHLRIAKAVEREGMGLASDALRAKVFLASAESSRVTAENRLALAQRELALAMGEKGGTVVDAAAGLPDLPDGGALTDRIAAALDARADLRAFSLRVENAAAGVDLQRSDYLPAVGLMGAWQMDGQDGIFSPDNHSWKVGIGLKWNIFDGFRREAAVGRSSAESGRAKAHYRGARDRAAFEVTRAYLGVNEAGKRVEIARSSAEAALEGARLIKARYENQLARMVDVLDSQTALNAARAELVKAENDLRQSGAELLSASGELLPWALPGGPEEKR
ncbi:MAG TPA: TolC family protein [Candidatus Deferrimicrobiaceae bacterium]